MANNMKTINVDGMSVPVNEDIIGDDEDAMSYVQTNE